MRENSSTFPWGVYIGDLSDDQKALPLLIPSNRGGFSVSFDESSEDDASDFIQRVVLKLMGVSDANLIKVNIFDFSYKKRFADLWKLKDHDLYAISLDEEEAVADFAKLEKKLIHAYHELLSNKNPTLSHYNQNASTKEQYNVLIFNLEYFPQDEHLTKRMRDFFSAAHDAGFYTIVFASDELQNQNHKSVDYFLNLFPVISFKNHQTSIDKSLYPFDNDTQNQAYRFIQVDDDKTLLVDDILINIQNEKEKTELKEPVAQEF